MKLTIKRLPKEFKTRDEGTSHYIPINDQLELVVIWEGETIDLFRAGFDQKWMMENEANFKEDYLKDIYNALTGKSIVFGELIDELQKEFCWETQAIELSNLLQHKEEALKGLHLIWDKKFDKQRKKAKKWKGRAKFYNEIKDGAINHLEKTNAEITRQNNEIIEEFHKERDSWVEKEDGLLLTIETIQAELDKIKEAHKVFLAVIEPEKGPVGKFADALNEIIWEPKVGDLVMTTHQEWPKIGRVHKVQSSGCVVTFEDYMIDYLYEQLKKL